MLEEWKSKLGQFRMESTKTPQMRIIYPTLGLVGEAGEVAEKVKKLFRDQNDNPEHLKTFKQEITKELGDVLWYVAALSDDLGINLDDVLQQNFEKLSSRKERDKLIGSGDNR